jgi:hypothetical protein
MLKLEKETPVSKDEVQGNSFVRLGTSVGLGDSYRESHQGIAIEHSLFYSGSDEEHKIRLDDAGLVTDYGDKLFIPRYVSTSTQLEELADKFGDDYEKALREVRLETGQVIADITQRLVEVQFSDRTTALISPQ